MRWMIGMLLLANLIVFLWWNTGQERVSAPVSVPKPDVGMLQLLSEVSKVTDESATDNPSVMEVKEQPSPPERPAMEPERELAKIDPGGTSTAPSAAPNAERPASEPPAPLSQAPERPAIGITHSVEESPAPQMPKVEQVCWELGPFEDVAQLETLRLPKEVERLEARRSPIRKPSGFYVLIPAQKDRKSARALVGQLKEKGVRDFWLFNTGPLKNAISLGLFNRERNAQQRRDEVAKLGFEAEVHARYRTSEGAVLSLRGPKSAAIERQLRSISAGQIRVIDCPPAESP